jgi:hypothetical protein
MVLAAMESEPVAWQSHTPETGDFMLKPTLKV